MASLFYIPITHFPSFEPYPYDSPYLSPQLDAMSNSPPCTFVRSVTSCPSLCDFQFPRQPQPSASKERRPALVPDTPAAALPDPEKVLEGTDAIVCSDSVMSSDKDEAPPNMFSSPGTEAPVDAHFTCNVFAPDSSTPNGMHEVNDMDAHSVQPIQPSPARSVPQSPLSGPLNRRPSEIAMERLHKINEALKVADTSAPPASQGPDALFSLCGQPVPPPKSKRRRMCVNKLDRRFRRDRKPKQCAVLVEEEKMHADDAMKDTPHLSTVAPGDVGLEDVVPEMRLDGVGEGQRGEKRMVEEMAEGEMEGRKVRKARLERYNEMERERRRRRRRNQ